MLIDERMAELKSKHDMLTERHNALVESIELWILESRERDARWNQRFTESGQRAAEFDIRLDKLLQIAEFHQERPDSHSDRLDDLEGAA